MKIDWTKVSVFAKKNAVSLAATLVALAAIGVILFWLDGQFGGLKERVDQRAAVADELQSIRTKARPPINLGEPGAGGTGGEGGDQLDGFPTRGTIENARRIMDDVRENSGEVLAAAIERNREVPLLFREDQYEQAAEVWPLAGEQARFLRDRWLREYRSYLNVDGVFDEESGSFPASSLAGQLQATRPPDAESIAQAMERRQAQIEAEEPINQATNDFVEPERVQERIETELRQLQSGLKYNRAADHMLYLDPLAIVPHPVAGVAERPGEDAVFEAQVKLWVQEAVLANLLQANLDAVASLPEEAQNVTGAPVKHVLALEVPDVFPSGKVASTGGAAGGMGGSGGGFGGDMGMDGMMMDEFGGMGGMGFDPMMGMGGMDGMGGMPTPTPDPAAGGATGPGGMTEVPIDNATAITRDYGISPTGRPQHNPLFDAVTFNLQVRVAASRVPEVLRQLQSRKLITVFNVSSLRPVDPLVALAEGFVYGDDAVVELTISGEMLLLREWTVPLMTEGVRQRLAAYAAGGDAAAG